MKRGNKARLFLLLAVLFALAAAGGIVLTALEMTRWRPLGGILVGLGAGGCAAALSQAWLERYFQRNPRERRSQEVQEKDERMQMIRDKAGACAHRANTPVFLAVWVLLMLQDAPTGVIMTVCGGYVVTFAIHMWALSRLQKKM